MKLLRRGSRSEVRVATWNLKQAVAPLHKPDVLWQWMAENVDPHVVAFTEGKVPGDEAPDGWTALLAINESRVLRSTKVAVAGPGSS
jgi:hypothetical protein